MPETKRKRFSSAFKLAVVAGLLVFCGAFAVLKMSAGTVKIAVAKNPIAAGEKVTGRNAGLVEIPRRAAPSGAVSSLEALKDKHVSVPRLPGDPITESCLTDKDVSQIPSGEAGMYVPLGPGETGSLKPNVLVGIAACPGGNGDGFIVGYFRVAHVTRADESGGKEAEALVYGDEQSVVRAAPWVKGGNFRLLIKGE